MPCQPHTATYPGKTVRIVLKTGEVIIGKFRERTRSKVVILDDGRRIPAGSIRAMSDRRLLQPISAHRK